MFNIQCNNNSDHPDVFKYDHDGYLIIAFIYSVFSHFLDNIDFDEDNSDLDDHNNDTYTTTFNYNHQTFL